MSQNALFAQFEDLGDLVRFSSFSATPFIHHVEIGKKHIYFLQILGMGGRSMIYYVERDEEIKGKYIVFNRFTDETTFSNKFESGGQTVLIPILELKRTNVFSEYPPK